MQYSTRGKLSTLIRLLSGQTWFKRKLGTIRKSDFRSLSVEVKTRAARLLSLELLVNALQLIASTMKFTKVPMPLPLLSLF